MEKYKSRERGDTKKMVYISLLVSLSIVLHTLETMIPLPSPWIKLGLSNIATLLALVLFGFKEALIVALLRVLIGSILFGTFLSPTFMLSLAGGLSSAIVMGFFYAFFYRYFSLVGISFIGAYAHTSAIILMVYYFIIPHKELLYFFPLFLLFSAFTGIFNGFFANILAAKLIGEKGLDFNLATNPKLRGFNKIVS